MCELLGMSANVPTDICFSFRGLMQRGGATGPHRDGWGIAFYEGRGCRTFHDPTSSVSSPVAQLISQYPIKSRVVVSHIRQATHGRVCLENTHPFCSDLNRSELHVLREAFEEQADRGIYTRFRRELGQYGFYPVPQEATAQFRVANYDDLRSVDVPTAAAKVKNEKPAHP